MDHAREVETFRSGVHPNIGEYCSGFVRMVAQISQGLLSRAEAASVKTPAPKKIERVFAHDEFVLDDKNKSPGLHLHHRFPCLTKANPRGSGRFPA